MAHLNFDDDLLIGKEGEKTVVGYLNRFHHATLVSYNNTKEYDALVFFDRPSPFGVGHITLEIKTDVLISPKRDTGNLFIETECRDKISGIQVTEADWFLYYLKHFDELWVITPPKLLALIRTGRFPSAGGGDKGSGTKGILIPREQEEAHFLTFRGIA